LAKKRAPILFIAPAEFTLSLRGGAIATTKQSPGSEATLHQWDCFVASLLAMTFVSPWRIVKKLEIFKIIYVNYAFQTGINSICRF
jgi:hypothetical protein